MRKKVLRWYPVIIFFSLFYSQLPAENFSYKSITPGPDGTTIKSITVNGIGEAPVQDEDLALQAALIDGLGSLSEFLFGFAILHNTEDELDTISDESERKLTVTPDNMYLPGLSLIIVSSTKNGNGLGYQISIKLPLTKKNVNKPVSLVNGMLSDPDTSILKGLKEWMAGTGLKYTQVEINGKTCSLKLTYEPVKPLYLGKTIPLSETQLADIDVTMEGFISDDILTVSGIGFLSSDYSDASPAFTQAYMAYHAALDNLYVRIIEKVSGVDMITETDEKTKVSITHTRSGIKEGEILEHLRGIYVLSEKFDKNNGGCELTGCLGYSGLKKALSGE